MLGWELFSLLLASRCKSFMGSSRGSRVVPDSVSGVLPLRMIYFFTGARVIELGGRAVARLARWWGSR